MPHEIATVLRCKLCPPNAVKSIAGPSLILGPGQSNRVGAFMQSLAQHLAQDHAQQHEFLQQKALEFMGLQTMMQYTTTDPNMLFSRDWLRWQIHQATLNARIPDDKLQAKSAEFAREIVKLIETDVFGWISAAQRSKVYDNREVIERTTRKVVELVTAIRNELQEPTEPRLSRPNGTNPA